MSITAVSKKGSPMSRPKRILSPRCMTLLVPYQEYADLRFIAYAYGRSISSIGREAIAEYLRTHLDDAHSRAKALLFANTEDWEETN